jgi:hypothetical protein
LAIWSCGLDVVGSAVPDASTDAGVDASDGDGGGRISANGALSFAKASGQYVNVPNIPIPSDFTLEVWVNPRTIGSEMMIVSEDRSPLEADDQFRLALTPTGTPYFVMTDQASSSHGLAADSERGPYRLTSVMPLQLGRWTHLAVSKSGSRFTLFVDGQPVASAGSTDAGFFPRKDNFDFRLGARMGNGGPANYFDGSLDEVRLFAVGRSQAEIMRDLRTELPTGSPSRADLVAYFRCDEGEGATAHDDVGPHAGTLENGVSWVASDAF